MMFYSLDIRARVINLRFKKHTAAEADLCLFELRHRILMLILLKEKFCIQTHLSPVKGFELIFAGDFI